MNRRNKKRKSVLKELQFLKTTSLFLLFVITLLSTGIYLISKNPVKNNDVKGINIYTPNSRINQENTTKYFSNALDIEFDYDNTVFSISERDKYITLSTINGIFPFKTATLRKIQDQDITEMFQNLEHIETINDNGVGKVLFSYNIPSLLKEEAEQTEYLTVMYKRFPNSITVYMQIWGYNFRNDTQTTNILSELMESLTLSNGKSEDNSVLSATSSIVNQAQILGQASTVRIFSQKCNNVKFSDTLNYLSVGGKTYTLCSAVLGSGFLIDDKGHVITNAHIADQNDFDLLFNGHSTDGSYENDMLGDLLILMLSIISNNAEQISEDELSNLVYSQLVEIYNKGYVSTSNSSREIYIQGNSVFEINNETLDLKNKEKYIKADLIKSNKISSTYESKISEDVNLADTADLAVLQAKDSINLPSIPITKNVSIGEKVFVIGYPALADNTELVSSTQLLSSTVTEGIVNAIKPNSNNTFNLIQIDAAAQNGNSGGPIVNEKGNAIGIVTYKISSDSGNYNFGISSEELLSFLNSSSIQPQANSMRKSLENSLADISAQHYKRAHENLQNMLILQPALTTVLQPLINLCSDKIAAGEDKNSIIDLSSETTRVLILIILVVLLITAVVLLLISFKKISDKQKQLPQTKLNTKNI